MLEDKVDLSSITQRQVKSEADGNIVTPKRFNKLLMQLRVGLRKPVNKIVKVISLHAISKNDVGFIN